MSECAVLIVPTHLGFLMGARILLLTHREVSIINTSTTRITPEWNPDDC